MEHSIQPLAQGWQERVQQAGYRLTRPRRAVAEVMTHADAPLTVAEVHRRSRTIFPHTGLVTAYRTLGLLTELGLVRRLYTGEGTQVYVRASLRQPAHHLICQLCRQVVEFPCTDLGGMVKEVEQQTGFTVREHWLEIFGLCPACQEKV